MEFEKKIDEKIKDFTFKEDEINEINEIIGKIMIDKFKELINNELFYLINNINILN